MSAYPQDVRYTTDHEWIRDEGDGQGTIGITWFAQDQLGDVVFVELPEAGTTLKQGEPFGVVESVKTVSDLYAPVDGEVVAVNERLIDEPELVNDDPYGEGWLLKIKISDRSQLDGLMDAETYRQNVEGDD